MGRIAVVLGESLSAQLLRPWLCRQDASKLRFALTRLKLQKILMEMVATIITEIPLIVVPTTMLISLLTIYAVLVAVGLHRRMIAVMNRSRATVQIIVVVRPRLTLARLARSGDPIGNHQIIPIK